VLKTEGLDLDGEDKDKFEIKVAAIRFAYKNGAIINKLKERGAKIGADAKFEEIEKIEASMEAHLDKYTNEVTSPVAAYVTFTTQEAKERCKRYFFKLNDDGTKNLDYEDGLIIGSDELEVLEAPEPSNVIWENI
jgi:DNA-binding transcriptional regulator of glucitol operon